MDKEIDVEKAWKDEEYRNSLTPEQLGQLPPNPAGDGELSEEDLDNAAGGIIGSNGEYLYRRPKHRIPRRY